MEDDSKYYDSWKEDRDLILEYSQVTLDDVRKANILGVGIDNMTRAQAVVKVIKMIEAGGVNHIMLINPYKLHRIKTNADLKLIADKAALILSCGAGMAWPASLLGSPIKERISILSFLMDIVRIAEIKEYSIFLVGSKPETAEKSFHNIKKSFPKIRIVGRHGGYFDQNRERSVIEAIRKSEPHIIFVGLGFPKEDVWINKIRNEFKNAVIISVGGSIDIISGDIKKAPAFFMDHDLDWFYRIITKPWRIGRLFRLLVFYLQVLYRRIRK